MTRFLERHSAWAVGVPACILAALIGLGTALRGPVFGWRAFGITALALGTFLGALRFRKLSVIGVIVWLMGAIALLYTL